MQRSRALIYGLIIVAIVTILYVGFNKRIPHEQADDKRTLNTNVNSVPSLKPAHLVEQLRAPQPVAPPASDHLVPDASAKKIAPECLDFFAELRAIDVNQMLEDDNYSSRLPTMDKCPSPPNHFAVAAQMFADSCAKASKDKTACAKSIITYRAMITDLEAGDLLPNETADPQLLANKAIAKLFYAPEEARTFAERLLEVEPDFYPAAKISAFLQMARVAETPADKDTLKENALVAIARAEAMNPADKDLYTDTRNAVRMASASGPEEQIREAKSIIAEAPARTESLYMSSWVAFKEGNLAKADGLLDAALAKAPAQQRYLDTKAELQQLIGAGKNAADLKEVKIYGFSVDIDPTELVP